MFDCGLVVSISPCFIPFRMQIFCRFFSALQFDFVELRDVVGFCVVVAGERASEFSHGGARLFFVLVESEVIIFDCLIEVASFVFAGSSCISCVDVVRVDFEYSCEVLYAGLKIAHLFVAATTHIVSTSIVGVKR